MAKSTLKRLPPKKRPRKAKANTRGALATETMLAELTGDAQAAKDAVERAGGVVTGQYRDPLGSQPLLLAVLPLEAVEPTPFQRDVSDAHHKKLADVLDRTGIFLDPIIAITAPTAGRFWTPNGGHRLAAMRRLGAKAITALVVPRREVAWQILALNTEKAHNLKDKSLEVIRIFRHLLAENPEGGEGVWLLFRGAVVHQDGAVLRAERPVQRRRVSRLRAAAVGVFRGSAGDLAQGP